MANTNTLILHDFISLTIAIIVYFTGTLLTRRSAFLRNYNIPEPVSGGLFAAIVTLMIYLLFDLSIKFELNLRDILLIYFFTAIGLNARISDLISGGRPLIILLSITIGYIILQNVIGISGARLFGMSDPVGVLAGSASLIGGHGTTIAWAPEIVKKHGITNALEIGIACATFGLILASLVGGPIARYLIERNNLKSDSSESNLVGFREDVVDDQTIDQHGFMASLLTLHIAIITGYAINEGLEKFQFKLPMFVTCLLVAIVMSNTIPRIFKSLHWPARTPSLALISDYSLNIFLAMSLMSMQLWTLSGLAGPLLGILALQAVFAVLFIIFIFNRLMGNNYESAVLSAGFGGFVLGATPTAIANMTAVAKKHGPAPNAFIILPLVAAFFVDIVNSFVIRYFLT